MNERERAALEHERSLRALLERIGDPSLPAEALEIAARRCAEAFEAMQASAEAGSDLGTPQERAALERARTQAALAIDLVRRELEDVRRRLRRTREARRAWGSQRSHDPGRVVDAEG